MLRTADVWFNKLVYSDLICLHGMYRYNFSTVVLVIGMHYVANS